MAVSPHFTSLLIKDWEIYFSQCYPNTALKIPELSNLMQLTAAVHADLAGVGFTDLIAHEQSWVMNRMRMEINRLPVWTDQVQIKTWVEELKGLKSLRNFELYVAGQKYIGVSSLWAIINTKTRRPDVLKIDTAHVERFPSLHATEFPNHKLSSEFEVQESFDYVVQFSDLDIVHHANNVKYLEWCLNHVEIDIILNNRIKTVDLNFIKELGLGDEVVICKSDVISNHILFKILKDEVVCFVCDLEVVAG